MAQSQYLTLPAFDPNALASNPVSSLGPARKWTLAVVDVDYGQQNFGRWLYIGGIGGTISYIAWDGTTVSNFPVIAGQQFFMESKQINSSGTTATNIWWSL